MRSAALSARRALAVAAAVLVVGATIIPEDADARAGRGGSFGSRGARTFDAPPPTATAPGAAPIQRSVTQPGQAAGQRPGQPGQPAARPGGFFGGGLAAGLMGGLLGAGLFGLLSGSGLFGGLGSLSSIVGLLIQGAIIFFVVRFALSWWRRRQQPQVASASAGAGPSASPYRFDAPAAGRAGNAMGYGGGQAAFGGGGSGFGATQKVELAKEDFDSFEKLLGDVQDAWSRQDISRMRGLATPEVVEEFSADLADDASRGVVNKISGVKLLQGDLAEAWREGARDYATVAMRYELVDVTEDRDSGRVVDGDAATPVEATELWTFVRAAQGKWLLSAVQQAA